MWGLIDGSGEAGDYAPRLAQIKLYAKNFCRHFRLIAS
jgi:hypothetical protein